MTLLLTTPLLLRAADTSSSSSGRVPRRHGTASLAARPCRACLAARTCRACLGALAGPAVGTHAGAAASTKRLAGHSGSEARAAGAAVVAALVSQAAA
jgi:hypothetical protein